MLASSIRPDPTAHSGQPWHVLASARLAHDRETIAGRYPGLVYHVASDGRVHLRGDITIESGCGVPTRIPVRIDFPDEYPEFEPIAYDESGRFPHIADRHFYADGRCCLWLAPESEWNSANGDALEAFLDQLAVFLDRQLVCEATGAFPGPQRSHGAAGYAEYIHERLGGPPRVFAAFMPVLMGTGAPTRNSACPCGSARKYKHCHAATVEQIRREIGGRTLVELFGNRPIHVSERQQRVRGRARQHTGTGR